MEERYARLSLDPTTPLAEVRAVVKNHTQPGEVGCLCPTCGGKVKTWTNVLGSRCALTLIQAIKLYGREKWDSPELRAVITKEHGKTDLSGSVTTLRDCALLMQHGATQERNTFSVTVLGLAWARGEQALLYDAVYRYGPTGEILGHRPHEHYTVELALGKSFDWEELWHA